MRKCVFSGTFDPPTKGHRAIINTCLKTFDEVVVAVMINPEKTPFLSETQRKSLLEKLFFGEPRVRVITFEGAAVDLLKAENTPFYVRGVRDCIDFEYENRNHYASQRLFPELITLYVPAPEGLGFVSSSLIRSSVKFKKDYENYIPDEIKEDLRKILENKDV